MSHTPRQDHTADDEAIPAVAALNETVLHPDAGRTVADFTRLFDALSHPARLGALYTIHDREGATHTELADALDAEGNGLNHHLRAIIETPLVRKTPCESDRRKMIYTLTPLGERIVSQVLEMMETERKTIENQYLDSDAS
ncbi:helix-turn-helix domain-containing protein [Halopiger djelfimassiliensis]|uniref:helix-turn-helix domain-containing protein n=1 Tax=Halopiger djelfimassiliensis TaxID=1293047 RepID=UPI0006778BC4|nr:helix-turn-helix domain-containing protein [Halopiger djelfimassiliensis]